MGQVCDCCAARDEHAFRHSANLPQGQVARKYRSDFKSRDILGEGSSSVVYRGFDVRSRAAVAIKVYKECDSALSLRKFQRQIVVLRELHRPFERPPDPELWHDHLLRVKPTDLFVRLIDFSRTPTGAPGPDADDGQLYIFTELAVESLKDYLARRRRTMKVLPVSAVRSITKTLVFIAAALHAKGLVHLDLKPENIMLIGQSVKLIDVDGCVRVGTQLSASTMHNASISFSLCYCAPEWARFVSKEEPALEVLPSLDVWSIGATICELVLLQGVFADQFRQFGLRGEKWAAWKAPRWLGSVQEHPVPPAIHDADPLLYHLLSSWMLCPDVSQRRTLAQCLSHPYFGDPAEPALGEALSAAPDTAAGPGPLPAPVRGAMLTKGWTPEATPSNSACSTPAPTPPGSPQIKGRRPQAVANGDAWFTASGDLWQSVSPKEVDREFGGESDGGLSDSQDGSTSEGQFRVLTLMNADFSGSVTAEPTRQWTTRSAQRTEPFIGRHSSPPSL